MPERCRHWVHWFDCDIDVQCVRRAGHAGLHRDGARWWDEHGYQQPTEHATGTAKRGPYRKRKR